MSEKIVKPLDLNKITQTALQSLAGISAEMARKIVAYRKKNGPFKNTSELMQIKGFTKAMYKQCAEFFFIESGEFGGEDQKPVEFSGEPSMLEGMVLLENQEDRPIRLTKLQLERTRLHAFNGESLKEITVRQRLKAGQRTMTLVSLMLDPTTAPGTYKGDLIIGNKRRPVIFNVAEVIHLEVVPTKFFIEGHAKQKLEKTAYVTNLGNVAVNIGDIGAVGVEEHDFMCRVVRKTVRRINKEKPDTDAATLQSITSELEKSYAESAPLIVRTKNKPVVIQPGTTQPLELSITISPSLREEPPLQRPNTNL